MNIDQIFFTADTHISHTNVIKYCRRPFSSIEEHDRVIIDNINNKVGENDTLYHLGDFCFAHAWAKKSSKVVNIEKIAAWRNRIKCKNIVLIMGNHDPHTSDGNPKKELLNVFPEIHQLTRIKVNGQIIVMCHYALRTWSQAHYGSWQLFGHSHYSMPDSDFGLTMDVGIDAVAGRATGYSYNELHNIHKDIENNSLSTFANPLSQANYRPISYHEVADFMKNRSFVPKDHHVPKK